MKLFKNTTNIILHIQNAKRILTIYKLLTLEKTSLINAPKMGALETNIF